MNRRDRPALEDRRQRRPMLVVQPRRLRWRIDLLPRIFEEFRIVVSQQTLGRVLRKMVIASSPRPLDSRHAARISAPFSGLPDGLPYPAVAPSQLNFTCFARWLLNPVAITTLWGGNPSSSTGNTRLRSAQNKNRTFP